MNEPKKRGRKPISQEAMSQVTIQVPYTLRRKIDARRGANSRSAYLRDLIEKAIAPQAPTPGTPL